MEEEKIQQWLLPAEGLLIYFGLPLLFYWEPFPLPKVLLLLLVAAYCGYRLWKDPTFRRGILRRKAPADMSKAFLIRIPLAIITILGLVMLVQPQHLFAFPAQRPLLWLLVMLLYPILSAFPQELVYRTYFFHRFETFLPLKNATVIASAIAFSFLHIVYDNWWAVGLSFIAGLFIGFTYQRTQSLLWVTVEHTLYGWLIFTLGFGNYFYESL